MAMVLKQGFQAFLPTLPKIDQIPEDRR